VDNSTICVCLQCEEWREGTYDKPCDRTRATQWAKHEEEQVEAFYKYLKGVAKREDYYANRWCPKVDF
jgi:hypothetical protein